ncbi:hypothetical protein CTAYLR_004009 [Chrysophaeum taylorii]|uniref:AMP-dependent synthetase/ligase domain-containing protein n=1 Tax=Chrysophaeum taylorii TaxID=2483200 RepID=A0AAD7XIV3_9STRA|nr:hypothetical protein CTAYLR_004009 [Chrysophaeum taylorii]
MVNFSPLSFLADPTFGYRLCTKRAVDDGGVSDINLSSLVSCVGGVGQRCVPSLLREFAAYFAVHCKLLPDDDGSRGIFVPNYGLAEHVVATCGENEGLVMSRRRPDLASLRYWGKPEMSDETFRARLDPDDGRQYLRTGDEAFVERGRLFICGRIKDSIIIGGENYYSDDVELAATEAMADAAARPGCIAAFALDSTDGENEYLCIVLEIRERVHTAERENLASKLKTRVAKTVGLRSDRVVFLRQETILRTTSRGKLRRRGAIRDAMVSGELQVVFD